MSGLEFFGRGYGVFFVALQLALTAGFFLEWLRDRRSLSARPSKERPPAVSIVVPVRDEEARMGGLLRCLLEQDLPVEIVLVDDGSRDGSPALLAEFAEKARSRGAPTCKVITLTENPGPNRKQRALSAGVAAAGGDLLLFTDGDCEAPSGWARSMARRMGDARIGALIGPVFKKKTRTGFLSLYQCFDHALRYNYLAGAIGLGAAGGGFGNNLMVSRAALDAIGGYDAVPPSPTEDAALISQIRSRGKHRVRAAALPDAAVETCAEGTWRSFVAQTLRWNNGGLFSPEPVTRLSYNVLMLTITVGALALPALPFLPALWPLPAATLVVMLINTAVSFALFRKRMPPGGFLNLGYLGALLFAPPYFTLMTLMGYLGARTNWKGKRMSGFGRGK